MRACDPNSREFLLYYAGVMLREAKARRGQNVRWMLEAAANARRRAMLAKPEQPDLFSTHHARAAA